VEKERSFLLPGKKGREIPELVSRIMDTLDVDGDRHITKVEFRMQWEKLCHDLFDGINQLKADSGGAGGGCCIVM
jgi:hypothetical protein